MKSIEEAKQLIKDAKPENKFQALLFTASLLTEVFENFGLESVVLAERLFSTHKENLDLTYLIEQARQNKVEKPLQKWI